MQVVSGTVEGTRTPVGAAPTEEARADARPQISVIMPSFNSGRFLREAITSVLSGPGPSRELVIQDAQSDDGTREVVDSFDDPRIRFVSEPDHGQADAVNRAVNRSRGEWILWLNADDALAPNAFQAISPWLRPGVDMVHGDWATIGSGGEVIRRYECAPLEFERSLRYGSYLYHGAMLIRRSLYDQAGPLDVSLDLCMDYDFVLRVLRLTTPQHCGECLALFRIQPASKSATEPWRQYRQSFQVARRHGALRWPRLPHTVSRRSLAAVYLLTRRLWRSQVMQRLRPTSRKGGMRR